ncbi:SCP2 sterol-binding domain-containing protein [Rhodophyticola sp. CCM32]|uniref:SCP2 sterol-binding domain-containing protein n=1 Tax=Rhodophyticola sp. CCM32 TaxID=2916397 RepID=UPI00107F9FAF|nr:SCP2 sterol-binding domain-containing protein [Rhodophyticola sp. CCM32]QBY02100.1 SCP2 sterol-binding domain-containing protein [Rhodophyticola sp. CCM32]
MALEQMAAEIQTSLEGKSFDGSLKFDCGTDGVIVLSDGQVTTEDQDTDCTIAISTENLTKLLDGSLNPATGAMMGKLKISGDMGVAMKMGQLLG